MLPHQGVPHLPVVFSLGLSGPHEPSQRQLPVIHPLIVEDVIKVFHRIVRARVDQTHRSTRAPIVSRRPFVQIVESRVHIRHNVGTNMSPSGVKQTHPVSTPFLRSIFNLSLLQERDQCYYGNRIRSVPGCHLQPPEFPTESQFQRPSRELCSRRA